jgi:hypothetical protein
MQRIRTALELGTFAHFRREFHAAYQAPLEPVGADD